MEPLSKKPLVPLAVHYNSILGQRGFTLAAHHYPMVMGIEDNRIPQLAIIGPPGVGKALAASTLLPTPFGWKKIDEVQPGEFVWHPSGQPTLVMARQDWAAAPLWRVVFADGREIVAHSNHLWRVHHKEMSDTLRAGSPDGLAWDIVDTATLAQRMNARASQLYWYVPLTEPVAGLPMEERAHMLHETRRSLEGARRIPAHVKTYDPAWDLPIPPYVLGCILGDGHIKASGRAEITSADEEMFTFLQEETARVNMRVSVRNKKKNKCPVYVVHDALESVWSQRLKVLGLAGLRSSDKFIPEQYMRASVAQRWALVQGMMDTDGSVGKTGRGIEYTSVSKLMAYQLCSVLRSLGCIASIEERVTTFSYKGEKRKGRRSYRVRVRTRETELMFRLPRKKNRMIRTQYADTLKLRIVKVEPAKPERSVCIQVATADGLFLAGDYVVTHNSTLFGVATPTWALGNDPTTTVLAISAGEKLVGTFLRASMEVIQDSPHFAELYPGVRPDIAAGWSSERGLFVTGRPVGDQDASYLATGLKSKALTGVHARLILLDDLHDEENSLTSELREKVKATYYKTVMGRADPRGCRFIAAGRRWAVDDIYGDWIDSQDWVVLHLPAIRELPVEPGSKKKVPSKQLWIDVYVPKGMTCVYTETLQPAPADEQFPNVPWIKYRAYYGVDHMDQGFYWPLSEVKRREALAIQRKTPLVFETVYQGNPKAGEESVFQETDFVPYFAPPDLELGLASPAVEQFIRHGRGHVAQAWDTAMGQAQSSALSANMTALLTPCNEWHRGEDPAVFGKCEFHFDVWLLDLLAENLDFGELTQAVRRMNLRWSPRRVVVEERVSGISLIQTLKSADVPLFPIKAVEGKVNRAVNGVGGGAASAQGWCRLGRVRYPLGAPWVAKWRDRMLAFTGDGLNIARADEFDATIHLITYAILRSKQTGKMASGLADGEEPMSPGDLAELPPVEAVNAKARPPGLLGLITQLDTLPSGPWGHEGMCGSPCKHWQVRAQRRVCALDGSARIAMDMCGRFAAL